jgi:hypothetical protein
MSSDGAPKSVICENSVIFQLHMTCNKILNRQKQLTSTVRIRTATEPMLSHKCFKIISITIALASVHRVIAKREIITDLTNLEGENVSQSTLIKKNFTACGMSPQSHPSLPRFFDPQSFALMIEEAPCQSCALTIKKYRARASL